ncbi:hypothetical protein HRbin30_02958 [bacterium HR30]|nr:hypothetical protein HRbin30_02958 [bacterium HR30]
MNRLFARGPDGKREDHVRPTETFAKWVWTQPRTIRASLAMILVASLLLNTIGIRWGLPNDNRTWSADALQPLAPMAVGRHVLFGDEWNSGWFYFKYPVGHPLVLLAAQAPLLAAMWVRGELRKPQSQYPFGFKNPEQSLSQLAVSMRFVTALMGTAVVFLAFCTAALLLASPWAGIWAALTTGGLYPLVFYSHTSNVDVPLLFWLALCCCATLWSARKDSRAASAVAGLAAAMALLTKEQGVGFLVAMPVVWLLAAYDWQGRVSWQQVRQHALLAGVVFLVTTAVVANVLWNPSGYFNRWRFLAGTLPPEIQEKYAPYRFLTHVPQAFSLGREGAKIQKALAMVGHSLTPIVAAAALVGTLIWLRLRWRALLSLGVIPVCYYAASLRALELVQLRYVLPLTYVAALLVGGIGALVERRRSSLLLWLLPLWGIMALAPGVETVRLLLKDPRYVAEAWLAAHWPKQGVRVEIYQPLTYLPRFPANWVVDKVSLRDRTKELFLQRAPDLVVLSSAGRAGLTGTYRRDWRPGEPFFSESSQARELFRALAAGELGYELGAQFATPSWLETRIPSLNPTISVYRRKGGP